jgi:hypothetical protein
VETSPLRLRIAFKWAMEKMDTFGFPSAVKNIRSISSGSPSSQAEKPGADDLTGSISCLICIRVSGPRRYDIAHRVWKMTGASS